MNSTRPRDERVRNSVPTPSRGSRRSLLGERERARQRLGSKQPT